MVYSSQSASDAMNKKLIAREYPYFIAWLGVGFIVVPLILFITIPSIRKTLALGEYYGQFYEALFWWRVCAWLVVSIGSVLAFPVHQVNYLGMETLNG